MRWRDSTVGLAVVALILGSPSRKPQPGRSEHASA
jgi:hypothetical protein